MSRTTKEKRARFRTLHESGCFVLPNPWDAGTARILQHLGFEAIASTSAGFAWSTGRPDYGLPREDILAHVRDLSRAVDLPVNADFEAGFGDGPEGVAESVKLAIATGVAGLSIEDRDVSKSGLYDTAMSLERLKAARATIDNSGEDVILVARTEGLLFDPSALTPAIDKLVAFADAGADCLYAPGVRDASDIAQMVKAVAPKPVNVVMMKPGLSLAELADLGVRRVSVGGALARVMWASVTAVAEEDQGRPLRRPPLGHARSHAQRGLRQFRTNVKPRRKEDYLRSNHASDEFIKFSPNDYPLDGQGTTLPRSLAGSSAAVTGKQVATANPRTERRRSGGET
jgi:2-methylisocitrate lyase-like PEP mutase family enzyme